MNKQIDTVYPINLFIQIQWKDDIQKMTTTKTAKKVPLNQIKK